MAKMRTSTAIAKFLESMATEYFFGYVGHGNWALLDALQHDTKIKGIRTRSEDHAVHMADCYYRMKRRPPLPVVCVTGGPGALNIPNPLAQAFYESSAMILLVGGGPTQWYDRGGIQEFYRYAPEEWIQIVKPICKKAILVHRPDTALEMFVRAYKTAVTGRPGPVVVTVPFDIQNTETEVCQIPDHREWTAFHPPGPDLEGVRRAVELLSRARRPIIIVSTGIQNANAWDEILQISELTHIPVGTTFAAKGAFPEDHPLYLGIPGRFGDEHSVRAVSESDLILAVGIRFNDLATAGWTIYNIPDKTKLIQIDIDPAEIARNYPVEVAIVADARLALQELTAALKRRPVDLKTRKKWTGQIGKWRVEWREKVNGMMTSNAAPLHYARLFSEASQIIKEVDPNTTVLFDTGHTLSYAPSFFKGSSRFIATNNDHLCRMGWSCPGLIGAKLANPNHPALAFLGDGSFMMTGTSVATAVEYDLPMVWVVLNNRSLQLERRMIKIYGRETFCDYKIEKSGQLWNPDFVKFAEAMGSRGERIERPEQIRPVLTKALTSRHPIVIDAEIDINVPVYNPTSFAYTADFYDRGLTKRPF